MSTATSFATWTAAAALCIALYACGNKDDLASVGGQSVTRQEFDAYLKFKRLPASDKEPDRYNRLLDQYLQRKALADAVEGALKSGDIVDAAQLQAEMDDFRREQLIARYFERYLDKAVTDDAVTNYYNSHADEFSEHRVHVAHILIRTSRAMSENERKAALTRIEEAQAKLGSGMAWGEIVEAYSQDSISAKKAGDLGWIQENAIDPKLSAVAFSLAEGKLSEPFETQFGFHILKVLEAPTTRQRPLESVKGEIRYRLRNEAREAELKRLTNSVTIKKAT